jgi:hypothetical protein
VPGLVDGADAELQVVPRDVAKTSVPGNWGVANRRASSSTSATPDASSSGLGTGKSGNSDCGDDPNSDHDVWMNVLQGAGIELPVSDKWVYLESGSGANDGGNFSTGHYYVCA